MAVRPLVQTDYDSFPPDKYPNIAWAAPRFCALDDPQNILTAVQAVIGTVRAQTERAPQSS